MDSLSLSIPLSYTRTSEVANMSFYVSQVHVLIQSAEPDY